MGTHTMQHTMGTGKTAVRGSPWAYWGVRGVKEYPRGPKAKGREGWTGQIVRKKMR